MSLEKVKSQIRFEIGQIENLLLEYDSIFNETKLREPNRVEIAAIASVLHSFYNGIENIFVLVIKKIDGENIKEASNWHKEVLIKASHSSVNRNGVISDELRQSLSDYLAFRHFFRHSYTFLLSWDELKRLANNLNNVWENVKGELDLFLKNLE